MKQAVFSKTICLIVIACLLNSLIFLPVMAFPEKEPVLGAEKKIIQNSSCSGVSKYEQTSLSRSEKNVLLETAGKNKKFSKLETNLINNHYSEFEASAYKIENNNEGRHFQVLTKNYLSDNDGKKLSLIYISNTDTGEVIVAQTDLLACSACLAGILIIGGAALASCIGGGGELTLGVECVVALYAVEEILRCTCSKCGCTREDLTPEQRQLWCDAHSSC